MSSQTSLFAGTRVIPLIQADDPATALKIARALLAGGVAYLEVVQRTPRSAECLAAIAGECPDAATGAGTVVSVAQAEDCIARGARFVVSPGLDADIVAVARNRGVGVLPGIMTPTELQQAAKLGLEIVKFFPAATAGGVPALKALASVFPAMRFVPTGGITADNLGGYLALDAVLACGGSWMTPPEAIARGDFDRITALAAEALGIATTTREHQPE